MGQRSIQLASPADQGYNAAMVAINRPKPVILCVLDGWGHREERAHNAIALARTPSLDRLFASSPHVLLNASSSDVGLPLGQMGNSEVGHMNLGAGRVVVQDLPRVDAAIADGTLFQTPVFADLIGTLRKSGGTCHVLGLLSPGGVHAHQTHIAAFAREVAAHDVPVAIHAFLDGRDTPPKSALAYLSEFLSELPETGVTMATVSGRYYGMDRDQRWERVERAYRAIALGEGGHAGDPIEAVSAAYEAGITDEFIAPTAIGSYAGMAAGDGLVMMNFRSDRAREILSALVDPSFDGFARAGMNDFASRVGLVSYSAALDRQLTALLPPVAVLASLGELIAAAGLNQLRIAETEKYAHVTFFFNGGVEEPFAGEERILIPSPKVATYDLKPEMSAFDVTDQLIEAIERGHFDFILVNYANTDMVGHTGNLDAAISAVEAVDTCVSRVADAVVKSGGTLIVTADHGNAERMFDPTTAQAHTAHTTELVPCLIVNARSQGLAQGLAKKEGRLADVAPTVLALLGISQSDQMTGRSLIGTDMRAFATDERQAIA